MLRLHTLGGLRIDGHASGDASEVRPRRFSLLAILAAAGAKGMSRDQVLAILWAEREPERARHSLSQAQYSLRHDLGIDVVIATSTLQLDPTKITSDVDDFRTAVAEHDWDRAVALYAGPFLDGFYLADAAEFERWADEERALLAREAIRATEAAARQAASDGRPEQATDGWRRLTTLDPVNGRFAASYMEGLAAAGDRAGAVLHGQSHTAHVRRELGVEPDSEVRRLIERLREHARNSAAVAARDPRLRATQAVVSPVSRPSVPSAPRADHARRSRSLWVGAAAVVLVAASGASLWRQKGTGTGNGASGTPALTSGTLSPIAERLYREGRRAYFVFDAADASRLFDAAVAEDSSFVMATYFAWRSRVATNGVRQDALADRAVVLASNAPERDRLLILAHVSAWRWDVKAIPIAESLATRFPDDPEALILAAEVATELPRAVALLDRAIVLDSVTGAAPTAACRMCDAFNDLARRYDWADSADAVERTLDRWSALRPADYTPWRVRADYLAGLGRSREADAALRRADSLGAPRQESKEPLLVSRLRSDDFDAANEICRTRLATGDVDEFVRYRWWCTIALRMQGRYRDALGLVRGGRNPWSGMVRRGVPADRVHAAILDMEMGRPILAAMQYAQLGAEAARSSLPPGHMARMLTWELTLSATASARGGDTIRVRSLVDSVEITGQRSLFSRDPLLHHFLRGLLFAEAGEHEAAVSEFRAATSSPSQGFTRINYEMGRSLLALGRPMEAIPVLRAPLRGGIDGSGLYLTRTETHELLARAFDAAGQRDSAAAHYAVVERAWRSADQMLATRHDAAQQRVRQAGRSRR